MMEKQGLVGQGPSLEERSGAFLTQNSPNFTEAQRDLHKTKLQDRQINTIKNNVLYD